MPYWLNDVYMRQNDATRTWRGMPLTYSASVVLARKTLLNKLNKHCNVGKRRMQPSPAPITVDYDTTMALTP